MQALQLITEENNAILTGKLQALEMNLICSICRDTFILFSMSASASSCSFLFTVSVKRRAWKSLSGVSVRDDSVLPFLLEFWEDQYREAQVVLQLEDQLPPPKFLLGQNTGKQLLSLFFHHTIIHALKNFRRGDLRAGLIGKPCWLVRFGWRWKQVEAEVQHWLLSFWVCYDFGALRK